MYDRNNSKRRDAGKRIDAFRQFQDDSPTPVFRLPPALQSIVTRHWRRLEKELAEEELLAAVACFNRYMWRKPIAAPVAAVENRERVMIAAIRELGEGSEFFQKFCLEDEDEMRYRCGVLVELFEQALAQLNKQQSGIIRLGRKAGRSLAKTAQDMGFASFAEVKAFYHRVLQMIMGIIRALLTDELRRPGIDARRLTAMTAWRALFERKAAASLIGKLLTSLPLAAAFCLIRVMPLFV